MATNRANKLTKGQIELQLRNMVSETKRHCMDVMSRNINKDAQSKSLTRVALEELCNIYEELCTKYIDGKLIKTGLERYIALKLDNGWKMES